MMVINIIAVIVFLTIIVSKLDKYLKERTSQKALEMNMNYHIDENDLKILDNIVKESFETYLFQNMEKMDNSATYIKSDLQNEMVIETMKIALLHISPLLRSKLSYIYDPDYIDNVVLQKTQMTVVEYCIGINGNMNEVSDKDK